MILFAVIVALCTVTIKAETIISTSRVRVLSCPKDIVKEYNGDKVWVRVTWREPRFQSLVPGKPVQQIASMQNGGLFFLGYRHKVVYNAATNHTDSNPATCSFSVLVKPKKCPCPTIKNPSETALACTNGKCVVLCKDGYTSGDTQLLFCEQGQWTSSFTPYPAECVPGKNWHKTFSGNVSDPAVVDNLKQMGLDAMKRFTFCQSCQPKDFSIIGGL